ncbi:MAG: hypothetical protein HKM04_05970 [Legionellales bacterium]|nr:hypothetical protein [Legionellales bacterium]
MSIKDSVARKSPQQNRVSLHKNILDIPFLNKRSLSRQFNDVLGLLCLDYVAVSMISSHQEMVILSSMPSLEFNLIDSGLWQYDDFFALSGWQQAEWCGLYDAEKFFALKQFKEKEYQFKHTLHARHQIDGKEVIYSFATKQAQATFSISNLETLFCIGAHCYRGFASIFHDVFAESSVIVRSNIIAVDFNNRILRQED